MSTRRHLLATLVLSALFLATGNALASPPVVEIVAMTHPPVLAALKPLRAWLATQGGKLRVVDLDAESPAGMKRLRSVGQTGHVPILILIDGQSGFERKDGSQGRFLNFPAVASSPPGIRGNWIMEDVQATLTARMK
jgi:hypothetical protein